MSKKKASQRRFCEWTLCSFAPIKHMTTEISLSACDMMGAKLSPDGKYEKNFIDYLLSSILSMLTSFTLSTKIFVAVSSSSGVG